MGLLEQYDIDLDEYEANEGGFTQPDEGWYEFQVGNLRVYEKDDGSWSGIFLDYLITNEELGVAGEEYSEIFGLPSHNPPTKQERAALERYKARIISLGVPESDVNEVVAEDIRGITGTFELEVSYGKGANSKKKYVNVRHLSVDGAEDAEEAADEEPEEEAPKKVATKAAPKSAPAKAAPAAKGRFQRG